MICNRTRDHTANQGSGAGRVTAVGAPGYLMAQALQNGTPQTPDQLIHCLAAGLGAPLDEALKILEKSMQDDKDITRVQTLLSLIPLLEKQSHLRGTVLKWIMSIIHELDNDVLKKCS